MPKLRKCCVVACESNYQTHRLFNFPKKDKLRELWLSHLVPWNVKLSGLSKAQLLNKYVCQKHFDRHQFDGMGNRLAYGYPCLFTEKEILHGIPLSAVDERDLSDHNYASQATLEEDSTPSTEIVIINAKDYKSIHNYTLICDKEKSTEALTSLEIDGKSTAGSLPKPEIMKIAPHQPIATLEPISIDLIRESEQTTSNKPKRYFVKRGASGRSFAKRKKGMAIKENKQKPFSEGCDAASKLSQLFIKNFSKMTKQAQVFLLMQLKMAGKKKKAMRYTTDEKLLIMSLMKETPEGYRLLQKIFNLPTKRTLNRLAERAKSEIKNENTNKQTNDFSGCSKLNMRTVFTEQPSLCLLHSHDTEETSCALLALNS